MERTILYVIAGVIIVGLLYALNITTELNETLSSLNI